MDSKEKSWERYRTLNKKAEHGIRSFIACPLSPVWAAWVMSEVCTVRNEAKPSSCQFLCLPVPYSNIAATITQLHSGIVCKSLFHMTNVQTYADGHKQRKVPCIIFLSNLKRQMVSWKSFKKKKCGSNEKSWQSTRIVQDLGWELLASKIEAGRQKLCINILSDYVKRPVPLLGFYFYFCLSKSFF